MSKDTGKNIFLFHGSENYLIKQKECELTERLIPPGTEQMNLSVFEEKGFAIENLFYATESLPFFNDHRLVITKNADFFGTRKLDGDAIAAYLQDIPQTTTLLIIESEIDKRARLFKKISEFGLAQEFVPLQEKDLLQWVVGLFKQKGTVISPGVATQLLRTASYSMEAVCSEAEKLISYCRGNPITADAVNAICTKSVESRIFELTGAIGSKRADEALQLYHNMISLKESPLMILAMIARQFRLILQCGVLARQRKSNDEIAAALKIRPFAVREYTAQSRNFTSSTLIQALRDCLTTDVNIKTGQMADQLAVEMLIVKHCIV